MYINSVRAAIAGMVQSSVKKYKLESCDTENTWICVENKVVMPREAGTKRLNP